MRLCIQLGLESLKLEAWKTPKSLRRFSSAPRTDSRLHLTINQVRVGTFVLLTRRFSTYQNIYIDMAAEITTSSIVTAATPKVSCTTFMRECLGYIDAIYRQRPRPRQKNDILKQKGKGERNARPPLSLRMAIWLEQSLRTILMASNIMLVTLMVTHGKMSRTKLTLHLQRQRNL